MCIRDRVISLFLAESNVRRNMRKKGVKKGRAVEPTAAEIKGDEVVETEIPIMARQATDLPPPPTQSHVVVRESSNEHLMTNDPTDIVSIHTPDHNEDCLLYTSPSPRDS
eukprot:TRINITY_DN26158_c0_g1_i2.p1 TRINITY_DN26158_c0_g1~~TRINITY_DN26158_c0_g1_i2.p1  ORF type:complete len:110 (-),score=34.03 TRINITY_DN26158_c0_g1_i2:107-436(-)